MWFGFAVLVLGSLLPGGPQPVLDCPRSLWQPQGGTQWTPTAVCDDRVLATEAGEAPWSWGAVQYGEELPAAFELSFRYRRLTPDQDATFEVHLPGGALLLKAARYGLYRSEAQFNRDGWTPLAPARGERAVRLSVRARDVEVWLDGERAVACERPTGVQAILQIAAKGHPGLRSRVYLRGLSLRPLQ